MPIAAAWISKPSHFRITFDHALTPGAINAGNWRVWHLDFRWQFNTATASANHVDLTNNFVGFADPHFPAVEYNPPPFDVLSSAGIPAAYFMFEF